MLTAKAHQIVGLFNHSSTVCEKPKKIKVTLGSSVSMQKALLLAQDVETKWNSTYLMLKRLENLKTSVQNYVITTNLNPKIFLQLMNGNLLASFMSCSCPGQDVKRYQSNSTTEWFFRAPGPKTKCFKRFFLV